MQHWQQRAEREDPYSDIPFHDGRAWNADALVGIALALAALLGLFV